MVYDMYYKNGKHEPMQKIENKDANTIGNVIKKILEIRKPKEMKIRIKPAK